MMNSPNYAGEEEQINFEIAFQQISTPNEILSFFQIPQNQDIIVKFKTTIFNAFRTSQFGPPTLDDLVAFFKFMVDNILNNNNSQFFRILTRCWEIFYRNGPLVGSFETALALEAKFTEFYQNINNINIYNLVSFAISVFRAEQFSGVQKQREFYSALLSLNSFIKFDKNDINSLFYYSKYYKLMLLIIIEKDFIKQDINVVDISYLLKIVTDTFDILIDTTTVENKEALSLFEIRAVMFIHEFIHSVYSFSELFVQGNSDFFVGCFDKINAILFSIKSCEFGITHMNITTYLISLVPIIYDSMPKEKVMERVNVLGNLILLYIQINPEIIFNPSDFFEEEFVSKTATRGYCLEIFNRLFYLNPEIMKQILEKADIRSTYLIAHALSLTSNQELALYVIQKAYSLISNPGDEIFCNLIILRDYLYMCTQFLPFFSIHFPPPQNFIPLIQKVSTLENLENNDFFLVHHAFNIQLLRYALSQQLPLDQDICQYVLKYFDHIPNSDGLEFLIDFLSIPNTSIDESTVNRIISAFPPLICSILNNSNINNDLTEKETKRLNDAYRLLFLVLDRNPVLIPSIFPGLCAHFINTCHFHQSCQTKSIFHFISFALDHQNALQFSDEFIQTTCAAVPFGIAPANIKPESHIPILAVLLCSIQISDNFGVINSINEWGKVLVKFIDIHEPSVCIAIINSLYNFLDIISTDDDPIYDSCMAALMLIFIYVYECEKFSKFNDPHQAGIAEKLHKYLRDKGQLLTNTNKERTVTLGTALYSGYIITHPGQMNDSRSDNFNKFLYDHVGIFFGDAERLLIKRALLILVERYPHLEQCINSTLYALNNLSFAGQYKDYLERNEFIFDREKIGIRTYFEAIDDLEFGRFDNFIWDD